MDNLKKLNNEIFEKITSNFDNIDEFYLKTSKEVIFGITKYIQSFYDQKIDKDIALQEFCILFKSLYESDLSYSEFWKKSKCHTNYNNEALDMLSEDTLNIIFKYISSALITSLINGTIRTEENYKSKLPNDQLTFYSAFQILNSHYDVMSYKGKIYDVFGYQYLGMIYNYKLYDDDNKEIKPMINENIILNDVIKLKLNIFNKNNYFDESFDLNEVKILDKENKEKTVSSIKITSIEYDLAFCNNESSRITNKEFKEIIEENFERVDTDFILPCADGVAYTNKEETANE
ncbi:hypothetical protein DWB98_13365 (plasmid) [Staphylococcus xylosus]|uniref:hypothetical protein n=1 Tax=Staphylococcus xylosus TaxID=1288 RepID=UPI00118800D5|nr:hypothetical protein [Staphylococcus xylosus]QDW90431.1 hypothetical protein DWB98_13365 [Staphylococcus xylosus]